MPGTPKARRTRRQQQQARDLRAKHKPCWLCGEPIDYDAAPDQPLSFSVDHIKPWSTHPDLREDPANLAPAHLKCNKQRGNKPPAPGLGLQSRTW